MEDKDIKKVKKAYLDYFGGWHGYINTKDTEEFFKKLDRLKDGR